MIVPTDDLLPVGYRFVTSAATGGVARLGTGHLGAVYLAVNDVLERHVAVKLVPAGQVMDRWSSASSIREAQTLAQLNHPNVVRVYDLVERGGADLIVMEYVSGGTLADLIAHAEPERGVRIRLLAETAAGLGYLHRCHVIHRDIKPSNILVTDTGIAKIADFGLVTTADVSDDPLSAEITHAIAGTPGHWSPEQARGEPLGPQSDVFSLATVAMQLLDAVPGDAQRHGHDRRSIESVMQRCLDPDPVARPRDGVELHHVLCAAADREGESWRRTSWRPVRDPSGTGSPATASSLDAMETGEIETVAPTGPELRSPSRAMQPSPSSPLLRPPIERLVVRPASDGGTAGVHTPRFSRRVRRLLMILAGASLGALAGLAISSRL
jgi:serine/threonine protein kinase